MPQIKESGGGGAGFGYKEKHFKAILGAAVYKWDNSYIHSVPAGKDQIAKYKGFILQIGSIFTERLSHVHDTRYVSGSPRGRPGFDAACLLRHSLFVASLVVDYFQSTSIQDWLM